MTPTRTLAVLVILLGFSFAGCQEDSSEPPEVVHANQVGPPEVRTPEVHGTPATSKTAAGKTAAGKTAAGKTSAGKTAAGKTSAGKTAAGKTSAGKTSAGDQKAADDRLAQLIAQFKSGDQAAQERVDAALVQAGQPAVPAIVAALRETKPGNAATTRLFVRASTIFEKMGPGSADTIAGVVSDSDARVRQTALLALSSLKVKTPKVIAALERAQTDPDRKVRLLAQVTLKELRAGR